MRSSDWSSDVCSSDLVSNALAQAEALMRGRTRDEAAAEMQAAGLSAEQTATLAPHRMFTGNRPSTTLLLPRLDPHHLGMLIALYEPKILVQGCEIGRASCRERVSQYV